MSEAPAWWECKFPSQEDLAIARNEIYSILNDKPIWNSITFDQDMKVWFGNNVNKDDLKGKDFREKYKNAHFLYATHDHHWGNRLDMKWLDDSLELLAKNENEKIVLMWFFPQEFMENEQAKTSKSMKLFLTYPNTEYIQLPFNPMELMSKKSDHEKINENSHNRILSSITFHEETENIKDYLSNLHMEIDHRYKNTHFIICEYKKDWWSRTDLSWLSDALELLAKNKKESIVLMSFLTLDNIKKLSPQKADQIKLFLSYPKSKLKQLPFNPNELLVNNLKQESLSSKHIWWAEKTIENKKWKNLTALISSEAGRRIWKFRHTLQHKEDPYDMTESEQVERLKEVQKFFPWLETFDKAMDYILHINLDLPEVMKWERIEWVYVDVDGTLIDYVGIHSGKEWTQKLRPKVVELLKKYEAEWKEIIVWTWWNVELKKKYLRSLWITRPVVSKYDYAWATAEIVIDDTGQNSFIAQSKIYPEVYINTTDS